MRDLSSSMRTAILRKARRNVSNVALRHSERRGAAWRRRVTRLAQGVDNGEKVRSQESLRSANLLADFDL